MPNSQTILVVDDAHIILSRIIELLSDVPGIDRVFTASDYDEAIKVLYESKPDLFLLDIHLPGKNGILLLKHIIKNSPDAIVIIISNTSNDYYRKLCRNAGALHFIDKSSEFDTIPGVVAQYT